MPYIGIFSPTYMYSIEKEDKRHTDVCLPEQTLAVFNESRS